MELFSNFNLLNLKGEGHSRDRIFFVVTTKQTTLS